MTNRLPLLGYTLAAILLGVDAAAQRTPPLVIDSMAGSDLFQFYCASCHGRDGKGGGPVAAALTTPPANLTTISRRNGGLFPRDRVIAFIAEQQPPVPAHGPRDMPVWGPIFRGLDRSDTRVRVRIENVVDYLSSIQAQ